MHFYRSLCATLSAGEAAASAILGAIIGCVSAPRCNVEERRCGTGEQGDEGQGHAERGR